MHAARWLVAATLIASGALAACSAADQSSLTLNRDRGDRGDDTEEPGADPGTGETPKKPTPSQPSTPSTPSTPGTSQPGTPGTPPSTPAPPPPPSSGPGSAGSAARQFFEAQVFPKIALCNSCHSTGASGAPKFMGATAAEAYQGLDLNGYITPNSRMLQKPVHANGASKTIAELGAEAVFTQWLQMEAAERAKAGGGTTGGSVWTKIQSCFTLADWQPVNQQIQALRTTRRNNENANQCTGCNQAACRTCHGENEYGFLANSEQLLPAAQNFPTWVKDELFLQTYIGTNGAQLVASPKIANKATATATGRPYSHPMFTVSPGLQTALNTFSQNIITKYNAKQCGQ